MHDHPWNGRTASIGLAKMRLDGFVSLDSDSEAGVLTTRSLTFEGSSLRINAEATGRIAVEVLGEDGLRRADCDPFHGDETAHLVTWRGKPDLSNLADRPIRLRFVMRDAKMFSFWFV